MTHSARSLFVFGLYDLVSGFSLAAMPAMVLRTLGFPPAADGWVRVAGVFAMVIGACALAGARSNAVGFIRASVPIRIAFAVAVVVLVVLKLMPTPLLAFGAGDLAGAIWTAIALRSEKKS